MKVERKKRRAKVDSNFEDAHNVQVFEDSNDVYDATLNMTDLGQGQR